MIKSNYTFKSIAIWIIALLAFFSSTAKAQHNSGWIYTGSLEYSLPLLTSVPPIYDSQPTDVTLAYLWLDGIMRSTPYTTIDSFIMTIGFSDTLRNLADIAYRINDDNSLSELQWLASSIRQWHGPPLPWIYKGDLPRAVPLIQNQIGGNMEDTGRAGFLIATDIIADVAVSDTFVKYDPTDASVPHMVRANTTILDEIKGKYIPAAISLRARQKGAQPQTSLYAIPVPANAIQADTGTSLLFEYSPEWSSNVDNIGSLPYPHALADSTGWWVRPDSEYIVFLRLAGIGSDTSGVYFSVQPYWGVFGTQGAMYKVVGGHVVDPNDDFGLGASVSGGLTAAEWKSRLRARIHNILNP